MQCAQFFCSLFRRSTHVLHSPDDQFPASIIRETQFESVQLQPEEIPAPLPQETSEPESLAEPSDSQTILAPDQPGNIQRGAGQQFGGLSDPNDTVLDPNQVGNLMTRLDALEDGGEKLPIVRLSGFFQLDSGIYSQEYPRTYLFWRHAQWCWFPKSSSSGNWKSYRNKCIQY